MNERPANPNDEIELDIPRLLNALLSRAWLLALVSVLSAVLVFAGTYFFITPKYQSTAMFYVNNNNFSLGEASLSITSSDISASRGLVKSYIVILNTRETINDVIDYAGVDRTYSQVKKMISAEAVDSTEIFKVVVTSPDPAEAKEIADAISYILPNRIRNIIDGTSAKVVDSAVEPTKPSSPSYTKNALLGFAAGFLLTALFIVLREIMDITVRSEEDIAQSCKHPVLAAVPDMAGHSKGGYYSYDSKSSGRKSSAQRTRAKDSKSVELVGGNISFAASEAYKLLRTKLQFSFTDESSCRVIGISSALTGEGKSLTSVNLAYTTSQLGKRVLLIDCDMRRSSLSEKLPIQKAPGLSDFLTGQLHSDNLIQLCGIKDDERAFHAIAAGRTPPNPMELLSSERMEKMLARLRESYDYIILDLPPVGEVGDALAIANLTDGILIVVRQNYCDRPALTAAIRQFEFMNARILGLVFNCTAEQGAGYGNKHYRKYYNAHYGASGGRYAAAGRATRKSSGKK